MKVSMFSGGLDTTLTARILPLAKALKEYGFEIEVIKPIDWNSVIKGKLRNIFSATITYSLEKCIKAITESTDVVIIGRTSNIQAYLLVKAFKRRKIKVIFDLDDALFLPVGSFFGFKVRPGSFYLEKILKDADYVTVDSHYLLYYVKAFNCRADILHVPVDIILFNPNIKKKDVNNKIIIGWQGNPRAHYQNLRMLIKPLEKIAQKYDIKFKIVSYLGDLRVKKMFKKLEILAEVDYGSKHWLPLKEFARLMSDFDIAVAPLHKTLWNEGKSVLRVGPAMAMSIPVVASPVGEQKYIIKHGVNGFLAHNEVEWVKYLSLLIEDEKMRRNMGKQGRITAERELSVYACGRKLFSIIREVLGIG